MTSEDDIKKEFLDPKKGYWGKSRMLKKYRTVLNKLYALQRHKRVTIRDKRKHYRRESAAYPLQAVQVDLADFKTLQNPRNKNVRYLMVCIYVFTRHLWVEPLTTKAKLHIPLKKILDRMQSKFGQTPKTMTGDNEFATTQMQALAGKYDFIWFFGDAHEKFRTGIVERSIGTIRNLIKRYTMQNNTTKYIDVLPDLIENYNDTQHDSTRTRPHVAMKTGQTFPKPVKKEIDTLEIGDTVRVLIPREKFDKGDKPYWSEHIYEVIKKVKLRYKLRNLEYSGSEKKLGLKTNLTYGRHQLLRVDNVDKTKFNRSQRQPSSNDENNSIDNEIRNVRGNNRVKSYLQRNDIDINKIRDKKVRKMLKEQLGIIDENKEIPERELRKAHRALDNEIDQQISHYEKEKKKYKRSDNEMLLSRIEKNIKNLKQQKKQSKNASKPVRDAIPYEHLKPMKEKIKKYKKKKKTQNKVQKLRRSTRIRKKPDFLRY